MFCMFYDRIFFVLASTQCIKTNNYTNTKRKQKEKTVEKQNKNKLKTHSKNKNNNNGYKGMKDITMSFSEILSRLSIAHSKL